MNYQDELRIEEKRVANIELTKDINYINENENKNNQIIKVFKRSSDDIREINNLRKPMDMNLNIEESEIDYQIKLIIDKMKNIKIEDELRLDNEPIEKYKISENLFIKNNYNNHDVFEKIKNISYPIAARIITEVSKKNLKEYIPFKNLEVNILIDCSRYIPNESKYFNIILLCSITIALNALKIKYNIGLVSDFHFKIELKKIDEPHKLEYIQMALDCIFIPRLMTSYASCLNYAINKFSSINHKSSERLFIMISNGLDKNLKLTKKWNEKFFSNIKHSFLFLFTECKFKEKDILNFLRNDIW